MATAKKKTVKKEAPKKASPVKTEASPVGRPPNLVKLTVKDVPSGVSDMLSYIAGSMGLEVDDVVVMALLHLKQQERALGQFGIKCLLERYRGQLGK